jgi:hypothetical protein
MHRACQANFARRKVLQSCDLRCGNEICWAQTYSARGKCPSRKWEHMGRASLCSKPRRRCASTRLGSVHPNLPRAIEVNRPYLHRQDANVTMLLPLPPFSSTFRRQRPARLPFSICGLSFPRPHRSPDRGAKRHLPTRDMRSEQHRSCVGQV